MRASKIIKVFLMQNFRKPERLCSRKSIGKLFLGGNSLFNYPFKAFWLENDIASPVVARIAVSVPARKVKKATDRNRIKRLFRESWRINKQTLYESSAFQGRSIDIILIYVSERVYDYDLINKSIIELIDKLISINESV